MRNNQKPRRRLRWLSTLVIVLVVLALIVFVGLAIANRLAANYLDDMIQEALADPGMPDIRYDSLRVDAAGGLVELTNPSVPIDEFSSIRAAKASISIPPTELIAYATGSRTDIRHADLDVTEFSLSDRNQKFESVHLKVKLEGSIDMNDIESAVVHNAEVSGTGLSLSDGDSGIAFLMESLDATVDGRLSLADLEVNPLNAVRALTLSARNGKLDIDVAIDSPITAMIAATPFLLKDEHRSFEHLAVDLEHENGTLRVDSFDIAAPLIHSKGSVVIKNVENPEGLVLDVSVSSINEEVRKEFDSFFSMFGFSIPDKSFDIGVDWDGQGFPDIRIQ